MKLVIKILSNGNIAYTLMPPSHWRNNFYIIYQTAVLKRNKVWNPSFLGFEHIYISANPLIISLRWEGVIAFKQNLDMCFSSKVFAKKVIFSFSASATTSSYDKESVPDVVEVCVCVRACARHTRKSEFPSCSWKFVSRGGMAGHATVVVPDFWEPHAHVGLWWGCGVSWGRLKCV